MVRYMKTIKGSFKIADCMSATTFKRNRLGKWFFFNPSIDRYNPFQATSDITHVRSIFRQARASMGFSGGYFAISGITRNYPQS